MLNILLSAGSNIYFGLKAYGTHGSSAVSNIVNVPQQTPGYAEPKKRGTGNDIGGISQTIKILIGVFSAMGTIVTTVGSWLGCKRCQKKENSETNDLESDNKPGMLLGKRIK